jgi:hypothetical protein
MNEPKRKRGRPKKPKEKPQSWPQYEGVSYVVRKHDHPQANTHKWVAVIDNRAIGYYKTPHEANEARVKNLSSGEK